MLVLSVVVSIRNTWQGKPQLIRTSQYTCITNSHFEVPCNVLLCVLYCEQYAIQLIL